MSYLLDKEELKPGLVLFRRGDVKHDRWYCRIKLTATRYQTISLLTADKERARRLAQQHEAAFRARLKQGEPAYNPSFAFSARAYLAQQRRRAASDEISAVRLARIEMIVAKHLLPYCGTMPMDRVATEGREHYGAWRRATGKGRQGAISTVTLASEISIFNAILNFAVKHGHLDRDERFEGRPKHLRGKRDGLTRDQYGKLMTTAKHWIEQPQREETRWSRIMVYRFIQVMIHTGMRPGEARGLRWRDVEDAHDGRGQPITVLHVRHRGGTRAVIAVPKVGEFLARIHAMSVATKPDDPVFTERTGQPAATLYRTLIRALLAAAGLSYGPGSAQRSTYSFRHAYAVERLIAGVDPYMLALQLGTSVRTIEDYYGHAMLVRHADAILGRDVQHEQEPYFRRRRTRAFRDRS